VASETTGVAGFATRYATALFELARDAGALDKVAADLASIKTMIESSPDLRRLVRSPVIGRSDQGKAMDAVLVRAEVHDLTRRFVGVVAANRRLFSLEAIIAAFRNLLAKSRGELTAVVSTAQPLSDAQKAALDASLRRAVGVKVAVETKVEPELLGGMIVRIGSRMFDSSLRSKLQRLQLAMKGTG
jgi:F-type H+-transporting ATPase subunit delta